MDFGGNLFFNIIPFVFSIFALVFYVGIFSLIILGIIFLYKKIQNESQLDRIEKEIEEIKLVLENMNKDSKGDLDEK